MLKKGKSFLTEILIKYRSADQNYKNIINNTAAAFIIRGLSLAVSFVTIPIYLAYFSDQQILGIWFTVLSVLNWILTFDIGIGNGLRNLLTKALTLKDHLSAKKYISSAYFALGSLTLLAVAVFSATYRLIDWNAVFNIDASRINEEIMLNTVRIVFYGIMLQFFLKLITSVLYALQKSAVNGLFGLCSNILVMLFMILSPRGNTSEKLTTLAFIYVTAMNVPLLLATLYIFAVKLKAERPSFKYFNIFRASEIIKLSFMFFWVQIFYMLIGSTNQYLITLFSGAEFVVEYQIYFKLFTLISTFFSIALTPVWSSVTKAIYEKKTGLLRNLYGKLKKFALIAVAAQFLMIPFLNVIVRIWLGDQAIAINYLYAVFFAVSGSMTIWISIIATIANGTGKLLVQAVSYSVGFVVNIPLAWAFVTLTSSWIGVILANIVSLSFYCIVQPIKINKFLNKGQETE